MEDKYCYQQERLKITSSPVFITSFAASQVRPPQPLPLLLPQPRPQDGGGEGAGHRVPERGHQRHTAGVREVGARAAGYHHVPRPGPGDPGDRPRRRGRRPGDARHRRGQRGVGHLPAGEPRHPRGGDPGAAARGQGVLRAATGGEGEVRGGAGVPPGLRYQAAEGLGRQEVVGGLPLPQHLAADARRPPRMAGESGGLQVPAPTSRCTTLRLVQFCLYIVFSLLSHAALECSLSSPYTTLPLLPLPRTV